MEEPQQYAEYPPPTIRLDETFYEERTMVTESLKYSKCKLFSYIDGCPGGRLPPIGFYLMMKWILHYCGVTVQMVQSAMMSDQDALSKYDSILEHLKKLKNYYHCSNEEQSMVSVIASAYLPTWSLRVCSTLSRESKRDIIGALDIIFLAIQHLDQYHRPFRTWYKSSLIVFGPGSKFGQSSKSVFEFMENGGVIPKAFENYVGVASEYIAMMEALMGPRNETVWKDFYGVGKSGGENNVIDVSGSSDEEDEKLLEKTQELLSLFE